MKYVIFDDYSVDTKSKYVDCKLEKNENTSNEDKRYLLISKSPDHMEEEISSKDAAGSIPAHAIDKSRTYYYLYFQACNEKMRKRKNLILFLLLIGIKEL